MIVRVVAAMFDVADDVAALTGTVVDALYRHAFRGSSLHEITASPVSDSATSLTTMISGKSKNTVFFSLRPEQETL